MAARLGKNTVMNCNALHSCQRKLSTGTPYIHSRIIQPALLKFFDTKRQFGKAVWPMMRMSNSCKIGTGHLPFCLERQRPYHHRLARNILGVVTYSFAKKHYSYPARNSIAKYKNVLKHGDFIFYEKTTENGEGDFRKFKNSFVKDFLYTEDFISHEEENCLLYDVEKALKRLKYEYDHWDGVSCCICSCFPTFSCCPPFDAIQ